MNTNQQQETHSQPSSRPLGYWLKATERYLSLALDRAFAVEGVGRREWRMLNVIDGSMPAVRPVRPRRAARLFELGWVQMSGEQIELTEAGKAAKERLEAAAEQVRTRVTDAVSAEALETTLHSLERIATALGWSESEPLPRRSGRRRGRGRGHGRGRGYGQGHRRWHGQGFGDECGHGRGYREGFGGGREYRIGHDHRSGHDHGCDRERSFDNGCGSGHRRGFGRGYMPR